MRIGLSRGVLEIRHFFRYRPSVIFIFGQPILLLYVLGSVFHGEIGHTGVAYQQYLTCGIIASSIMAVTFLNLGIDVGLERDNGTLKLLAGTPMPRSGYFIGKAICALTVSALQVAILLAIGRAFFGVHLPALPGRWLTLCWVFVLGVVTCSLLGIAVASAAGSARNASAAIQLPYLVLSFISGVYFVFGSLPKGLQQIAALFPLKWLCQGIRSALLPDSLLAAEPAHSWEHGRIALVLAAWLVAGLVLCIRKFRWKDRRR